jgi:crotonobetainyl-CoA:carnitine CoA-transferase CaiB-like acyl-CoA transferase
MQPAMQETRRQLDLTGLGAAATDRLVLTGDDPVLPSSFAVGCSAQAPIAALGCAAAEIHRMRTGQDQEVAVDMRHAAVEFRSERYLRVDGRPLDIWDNLSGAFYCSDGRWVRIHMLLPHHRDGVLDYLGCAPDRGAIAAALLSRTAQEVEDECARRGLVVAMMRTFDEWDGHPEGRAVAAMSPIRIERIGDAPPQPLPPGDRPLSGVRILDLTRIIAGPVCGRALAAHGADVLYLAGPRLPFARPFVIDSGRGKRSAFLDLDDPGGAGRLRELVAGADVFLQSFRPGALSGRGFAPADLAALRPGIISLGLSAYSTSGPWRGRRGFDSLVQTASGLNHAESVAKGQETPLPLPCQVLDHASGYFLALGALAALHRRATEGGSWHVSVSLAATGQWLRALGSMQNGHAAPDIGADGAVPFLYTAPSGFGELTAVRHAALLSETPAVWDLPSVPLGTHAAAWAS